MIYDIHSHLMSPSQVQPKVEPSQAAPAPALPALPALPVPAVQPKAVNGTKSLGDRGAMESSTTVLGI